MKALIVIGRSEYDYHVVLARAAAQKLTAKGYEIVYVNTAATEDENIFKYAMSQAQPDLLVTFDCAGFKLELLGDDIFYNSLCCQAVHVLCHRPFAYDSQLRQRVNFITDYYCFSQEDGSFIKEQYKRVPQIHTIEPTLQTKADVSTRPVELLLPGDYVNPVLLMNEIKQLEGIALNINLYIIRRTMEEKKLRFYDYVREFMEISSIPEEKITDIVQYTEHSLQYILAYKKDLLAKQLINDGIPFAVCGMGWQQAFGDSSIMIIGGNGMSFEEYVQILGHTKAVINCHPHRPDALTLDRIYGDIMKTRIVEDISIDNEGLYQGISLALS